MLQLIGAEVGDISGKLRILVAEVGELVTVVAIDFRFDRVGAGKRRLFGHQRRGRASANPATFHNG